jgi:hypothetical protein
MGWRVLNFTTQSKPCSLAAMKIITRPALRRLAVIFAVLTVIVAYCWWTMIRMPSKSFRGALPPLTAGQLELRDELQGHVQKLAVEIGSRSVDLPASLKTAARYIEATFTNAGFTPSIQSFDFNGVPCQNIEVEIPGNTRRDEIVVIGAHYDSESDSGTPGADDNASGTAAVLALAKRFAGRHPARTLRFVAFVNEEPPFFQYEQMGSLVYAKRCQERNEKITAMMSIESIGYYDTKDGSQKYPFPVGLFYPSRADFIAFVSRTKDAALVRQCIGTFREDAQFPSEGAALPSRIPGVGWSDHWAFWQAGYPAVMVTDTTLFRSPHYHQVTDTADTLDYDRMARVVDGVVKVIADLCNR